MLVKNEGAMSKTKELRYKQDKAMFTGIVLTYLSNVRSAALH